MYSVVGKYYMYTGMMYMYMYMYILALKVPIVLALTHTHTHTHTHTQRNWVYTCVCLPECNSETFQLNNTLKVTLYEAYNALTYKV